MWAIFFIRIISFDVMFGRSRRNSNWSSLWLSICDTAATNWWYTSAAFICNTSQFFSADARSDRSNWSSVDVFYDATRFALLLTCRIIDLRWIPTSAKNDSKYKTRITKCNLLRCRTKTFWGRGVAPPLMREKFWILYLFFK